MKIFRAVLNTSELFVRGNREPLLNHNHHILPVFNSKKKPNRNRNRNFFTVFNPTECTCSVNLKNGNFYPQYERNIKFRLLRQDEQKSAINSDGIKE